jgi:hypothetical protein
MIAVALTISLLEACGDLQTVLVVCADIEQASFAIPLSASNVVETQMKALSAWQGWSIITQFASTTA